MNVHSNEPRLSSAPAHGDVTIRGRLSNISKFYSGVPALRDVSVESTLRAKVHAILGENGAGKSTLMNIISGTVHPELGEIRLSDRRISNMSPEIAASLGISISFQHPAILDDLSVLENLQVALPASVFGGKAAGIAAKEMLDVVGSDIPLRTRADALTVARRSTCLRLPRPWRSSRRFYCLTSPPPRSTKIRPNAFRTHSSCR